MNKKNDNCYKIFAALGDKSRLQIISLIKANPKINITNLASFLPFTRQGLSKHIAVLASAGIVKTKKNGRTVSFFIDNKSFAKAQKSLSQFVGTIEEEVDEVVKIEAPKMEEAPIVEAPIVEALVVEKPIKKPKPIKAPAPVLDQLSLF